MDKKSGDSPKPIDPGTVVKVTPGTHEHTIEVEKVPTEERRKAPAPVNVAVSQGGGLSGIWGIVGNMTAITFVMGMFYLIFQQYSTTLKNQIEAQRIQTEARDLLYRDEMKAMRELEVRRYEAEQKREAAFQSKLDALILNQQSMNMEVRASRMTMENANKAIEESNTTLKEMLKQLKKP